MRFVTVLITRTITLGGRDYEAGCVYEVPVRIAQRLRNNHCAEGITNVDTPTRTHRMIDTRVVRHG